MGNTNLAMKKSDIIDCSELFESKKEDDEFAYKIKKEVDSRAEKKAMMFADKIMQDKVNMMEEKIRKLEENVNQKQLKLQMSIPTGVIAGTIITSCMMTAFSTLFIYQIVGDVKIIDYYLILFCLVGSTGLFCTSLCTIKEWKRYIANEE